MMRKCDFCGNPYQAKRPQSKYCSTNCRVRNSRTPGPLPPTPVSSRKKKSGSAATSPSPGDAPVDLDANPSESALVRATRAQLENAGVVVEESMLAQQSLRIAEQMSGRETAGGMASLSKELSRVMAEALRSAPPLVADPMDELRAKREAKAKLAV